MVKNMRKYTTIKEDKQIQSAGRLLTQVSGNNKLKRS